MITQEIIDFVEEYQDGADQDWWNRCCPNVLDIIDDVIDGNPVTQEQTDYVLQIYNFLLEVSE